jgi:hypothetical protein
MRCELPFLRCTTSPSFDRAAGRVAMRRWCEPYQVLPLHRESITTSTADKSHAADTRRA